MTVLGSVAIRAVPVVPGVILVRAGASKLAAPWPFRAAVQTWGIVPVRWARQFARTRDVSRP